MLIDLQLVEENILNLTFESIDIKINMLLNLFFSKNKEQLDDFKYYFNNYLKYLLEYNLELAEYEVEKYNSEWLNALEVAINYYHDLSLKHSIKRNDQKFREEVIKLSNYKDQVYGHVNNFGDQEICHIYEFKNCNNDNDRYNKFNGLNLTASIHKAWDNNGFKISYNEKNKNIFFILMIEDIDNKFIDIIDENGNIPIIYNKLYFEEYKKYIDMRNNLLNL